MRPTPRIMATAAARATVKLPTYFARGTGPVDAALNVGVALRRLTETALYEEAFGRLPNYVRPTTYTEKIQWRKMFDRTPELAAWCDKLVAKNLARERAPEVRLPRLIWSGTDPEAVPIEDLEPPYVVKANNRSAAVILVPPGATPDASDIRASCRHWIEAGAHRRRAFEWGYAETRTKVYVEEYLSVDGLMPPPDLKLFVFHGRAHYLYYRDTHRGEAAVLSPDWKRYEWDRWERLGRTNRIPFRADPPRPAGLRDAIDIGQRIAGGLDHLRVDLYLIDGSVYFGEATVYPSSGNKMWIHREDPADPHPSDEVDRVFGSHWQIHPFPRGTMTRRGLGPFR